MNVASLELSKELYELSGWDDCYWQHAPVGLIKMIKNKPDAPKYLPAYDLGYLLRKLPPMIEDKGDEFYLALERNEEADYMIAYSDRKSILFGSPHADTPEDAACMLAIELFKQGILTKETN